MPQLWSELTKAHLAQIWALGRHGDMFPGIVSTWIRTPNKTAHQDRQLRAKELRLPEDLPIAAWRPSAEGLHTPHAKGNAAQQGYLMQPVLMRFSLPKRLPHEAP